MFKYQATTQWELDNVRASRPGAEALKDVLLDEYPGSRNLGIYCRRRVGGKCGETAKLTPKNASNHSAGRAIDFGCNKAQGDSAFLRLIAAAKSGLPVCELIWYRQRWTPETGVRGYGGPHPHTDHIHITITTDMACCPNTLVTREWIRALLP